MTREYLVVLVLSAALATPATNACESAGPATASEVFTGREAQVSLWQKDFENPRRAVYVRTTDCVRVSEIFPVALETGRWRGVREGQADGSGAKSFAAGVYAAKWRRVDGTWLLESEVFATEACGGDFCPVDDGDR